MKYNYHNWTLLPDNIKVYAYRSNVKHTTLIEKAVVGEIHENLVVSGPGQWTGRNAYRLKSDNSLYKKATCRWSHQIFDNKQEAEQARQNDIQLLRRKLNDKIKVIQDRLSTIK